jgi:dTDP-4-amino-4,6-dideoxygalactose transaminase
MKKFCSSHIPDFQKVRDLLSISECHNHMSNFGPVYELLRKELVKFLHLSDKKDIVVLSSGHTAIMTALSVLGSRKVLIPAFTFASTLQAATLQGIKTTLCDVSEDGYLTPKILETQYETQSFDTVLLVTPLSVIPPIKQIYQWCQEKQIKLIIDGAASFGSSIDYDCSDAYCLSFHATKSFPVGEGGGIVLNKDLLPQAKSYINFGMNSNREIVIPGINGKVSELTCAFALTLLEELEQDILKRDMNAQDLSSALLYNPNIVIPMSCSYKTIYQCFPIFIYNPDKRKQVKDFLTTHGFAFAQYYKPLKSFPVADSLFEANICLPCHPDLTVTELDEMISLLD